MVITSGMIAQRQLGDLHKTNGKFRQATSADQVSMSQHFTLPPGSHRAMWLSCCCVYQCILHCTLKVIKVIIYSIIVTIS